MLKIFKYLAESKWSVLAIIALLVVQAYCDLALPQYTADIVDVGIGQKGIESAVPERMRESTYRTLESLLTREERELMASAYEQAADGSYVFCGDKQAEEALDGSVYNVATEEEISIIDLVKLCGKKLGIDNPQIIFKGYRESDPERRVLNTEKIRERTGWAPAVTLDAGIEMCVKELGN